MRQIFNLIYILSILVNVSVSVYLGWWILRDWRQLDYTHNVKKDHNLALHHRINLVGEGTGFFISNTMILLSIMGLNINNK
ncbi:MAG: hypothetical protein GW795_13340 [Cyanobacteria bacterium]|nr:hypothetical protein [Cyanobacteria bacterium CG_2015-16_32_12]NCO77233.1 hypothetical protein [Cyanobacteria bacterium CG_2015-22_32_23]NCQ03713.1 hypothetical protein [Cyanobacteria bacterium CG_2015-09_32_10]NCQ42823.1 hypothetical protein [Cyanobacteria bacterium CG_2015-04_32_10]NCS86068.1 hypothetical protein [Cyanobacteria bacterium CG_2015-02_32_10]